MSFISKKSRLFSSSLFHISSSTISGKQRETVLLTPVSPARMCSIRKTPETLFQMFDDLSDLRKGLSCWRVIALMTPHIPWVRSCELDKMCLRESFSRNYVHGPCISESEYFYDLRTASKASFLFLQESRPLRFLIANWSASEHHLRTSKRS